ncbi:hypothetical protein ACCO45_011265 [Purpureocillium lilacinum]|uniref:Uncharacterized protein n=1 Tax=Purpureocillium lilacinum TaxID=33203 RepID=A0ACC4DH50_PURLI
MSSNAPPHSIHCRVGCCPGAGAAAPGEPLKLAGWRCWEDRTAAISSHAAGPGARCCPVKEASSCSAVPLQPTARLSPPSGNPIRSPHPPPPTASEAPPYFEQKHHHPDQHSQRPWACLASANPPLAFHPPPSRLQRRFTITALARRCALSHEPPRLRRCLLVRLIVASPSSSSASSSLPSPSQDVAYLTRALPLRHRRARAIDPEARLMTTASPLTRP